MIERRANLSQGDIVAEFHVPEIPGAIESTYVEYGVIVTHSCELDKPESSYAGIATAWRASTLREQMTAGQMDDMLSNRVLSKVAIPADPIGLGEYLVCDLNQISTWPIAWITSRVAWSLSDDAVLFLQSGLIKSFSLREITREKSLSHFKGQTVAEIRTVKDGSDDTKVEVTFTDEQVLILYTHKRKR